MSNRYAPQTMFFVWRGEGLQGEGRDVNWLIDLSRLTPASQAVPTATAWE